MCALTTNKFKNGRFSLTKLAGFKNQTYYRSVTSQVSKPLDHNHGPSRQLHLISLKVFPEQQIVLPDLSRGVEVRDVGREVLDSWHELADDRGVGAEQGFDPVTSCRRRCGRFRNWSCEKLVIDALTRDSNLIVLRSSVCWIGQQPDKWLIVQPTWMLSSNSEASLRGHERLKDQLQESG